MTDHYKEWRPRFNALAEDMLSWESLPQAPGKCSGCLIKDALYRCTECWDTGSFCASCLIEAHKHLWFHWIERWNGQFFVRYDMASIGFVIYLGHHGLPCPGLARRQDPSNITICHTNGIHRCKLQYCNCSGALEKPHQLIRARLWPATLERPQTAFTIPLLRLHDHLWLISKVNANNFMKALQRLSNNMFPGTITVC